MPDCTVKTGIMEMIPSTEVGKVVQFERFGFARIASISPQVVAFYTQ
jgi:glutamyl-tRNA synthetase